MKTYDLAETEIIYPYKNDLGKMILADYDMAYMMACKLLPTADELFGKIKEKYPNIDPDKINEAIFDAFMNGANGG
jgi:hypothetical protein